MDKFFVLQANGTPVATLKASDGIKSVDSSNVFLEFARAHPSPESLLDSLLEMKVSPKSGLHGAAINIFTKVDDGERDSDAFYISANWKKLGVGNAFLLSSDPFYSDAF